MDKSKLLVSMSLISLLTCCSLRDVTYHRPTLKSGPISITEITPSNHACQ